MSLQGWKNSLIIKQANPDRNVENNKKRILINILTLTNSSSLQF